MFVNLQLNKEYTKDEIEEIFNTNFGYIVKGITLRKWEDETPYIILFSRKQGLYTDKIEGDILYYDGEGLNKNQKLTAANKALIESNNTGRIIFGFRQESIDGKWKYIGILKVIDYKYITKRGFGTYEFKIKTEGFQTPEEFSPELEDILAISNQNEPQLTDEGRRVVTTTLNKKERNGVFSKKIKGFYDNSCVVCRKKRFTAAGYPEVEAAHIYPKEKNGSDDFRNGIALCKLHHWAFDNGLIFIDDDLTVRIWDKIQTDGNYEEISKYKNFKILLPNELNYRPHPVFLSAHRKLHGFE